MSTSAVKAGEAFVEVSLKDKIQEGARRIQSQLNGISAGFKSFGTGLVAVGASATAAFGSIAATIGAAAMNFSEAGSELADMSARTGISASVLSGLGYAAKMSGSSLEDLEGVVRKMQKTLGDAAGGSKQANDKLSELGLSASKLMKLSPDQQFAQISKQIAKIDDPTMRAAAAMEIFGKSATSILPLITSDITATIAEAKRLGIVMSDADASAADDLGDSIDGLKSAIAAAYNSIGAAVAGPLTAFAKVATDIVGVVGNWIGRNRELFLAIGTIAVAGTAAGVAITALGGAFIAIGSIIAGVAAAAPFLAVGWAAITAAIAPAIPVIGMVAAGLVTVGAAAGSILYIANQAGILSKVFSGIQSVASELGATVSATFGGIGRALASGEYSKAAEILWTGIKVAFFQGAKAVLNAFSWLWQNGLTLAADFSQALGQTLWDIFSAIPKMLMAALSGGASLTEIIAEALTRGVGKTLDESIAKSKAELAKLTADPAGSKDQPGKGQGKPPAVQANAMAGANPTGQPTAANASDDENAKAIQSRIQALKDETAEMRLGANAFDLLKLKQQGATAEQLAQVQALQQYRDQLKAKAKAEEESKKATEDAKKKAEDDRKDMMARGKQLADEVRSPFQVMQDKIRELDTLYANGAINKDTYQAQRQNATNEFQAPMRDALKNGRNTIAEINSQASLDVMLRTKRSYNNPGTGKSKLEETANSQLEEQRKTNQLLERSGGTTIKVQLRKL